MQHEKYLHTASLARLGRSCSSEAELVARPTPMLPAMAPHIGGGGRIKTQILSVLPREN